MTPDERVRHGVARLGSADAGELLTLQMAAWVIEAIENDTLAIPALHETIGDVRAQLAEPEQEVWGVRENGRLLATVRNRVTGPRVGYIGRLGVVPDVRGTGLGGALLAFAEARFAPDVHYVELMTGLRSVTNHAFYEHRGYRRIGQDPAAGTAQFRKQLDAA